MRKGSQVNLTTKTPVKLNENDPKNATLPNRKESKKEVSALPGEKEQASLAERPDMVDENEEHELSEDKSERSESVGED